MDLIERLFSFEGKISRIEFILVSFFIFLFNLIGIYLVFGYILRVFPLFSILKLVTLLFFISICIWHITAIKRCRSLKIPIVIVFIPTILIITSIIFQSLLGFLYMIGIKFYFILITILCLLKDKN